MKRCLMMLLLALSLLRFAATAEGSWDSRAYLTPAQGAHETAANEGLLAYVQPIDGAFVGDMFRVDMIDALYDGYTLVMTWTVTNTSDAPLLLLCDPDFGDAGLGSVGMRGVDEEIVYPGGVMHSGMTAQVSRGELFAYGEALSPLEACEVHLQYTAYALQGEVADVPEEVAGGHEFASHWADRQIQAGIITDVDDPYDVIWRGGMTRTESVETSGLFARADALDISLDVACNAETISLLPDGKPVEQQNGDYTLRLLRANLAPNTLVVDLDIVFATEEAARPYLEAEEPSRSTWSFSMRDETGGEWWSNQHGYSPDGYAPALSEDGEWVWHHRLVASEIARMPLAVTLQPQRSHVPLPEDFEIAPEVGITLAVPRP